jgi:small-conductance mechanosensitive channel
VSAEASNSTSLIGVPGSVNILGVEVTLASLLLTIIIIVAGFAIAHAVRLFTVKYFGNRLPPDTRKTVSRTFYYGIVAVALLSALGVSGLDLSGLFLAGGIAGIVIGFAMQSLFSNLISGIFLHFDKPMKIGDPVLITGKLPDVAGVVVEVTALSTRVRMFDGTYVRLPNSDVFLSEIRNYSGAVARRVEFAVGVSYDSDTQKVMQVIRQSLADTPLVLVEPAPDVYVDTLADSAVNINVWCWVPFSLWFDMRKQLVEQVMNALTKSGIEIPFPQRVVYLKKSTRRKKPGALTAAEPPGPGAGSSSGVNLEEMVED